MRIAFVTPCIGQVHISWAVHMFEIISATKGEKFFVIPKHYCIDKSRNNAVLSALTKGATHIMFIDSDIIPYMRINGELVFIPEVINHMLSYRYPIVSGIYQTTHGHAAVYKYTGGIKPYEPIPYEKIKEQITFADAVGCGLVLIDARVFVKLKEMGYFPWFEYKTEYKENKGTINILEISEDIDFFDKCRKCGFRVMVLPNVIGVHLHTFRMYPDGKLEVENL